MPQIPVHAQIFDLVFHPTFSTVYTGLLTGYVEAFAYDRQGNHKNVFSLRPSKRSCRGLSINEDGSKLYAAGKSKAIYFIDTKTEQIESRVGGHESPINRVKHLTPWSFATGDDEGVIKLWDPRRKEAVCTYSHHFDYISDFLWLDDKKQLVATSADGTLSVMDVRSKQAKPVAQSEDQEDELLSIVAIKGEFEFAKLRHHPREISVPKTVRNNLHRYIMSKIIVGTQVGILSVFNRSSGWGDCVDRIPGHPLSIDALCNLPDLPGINSASTVLTGSSDGYVRAVQILPTKLLGVVADHGDWPVERIAVGGGTGQLTIDTEDTGEDDEDGLGGIGTVPSQASRDTPGPGHQNDDDSVSSRRWWVGSVGHEDGLRLTNLMGFFRDGQNSQTGVLGVENDSDVEDGSPEFKPGIELEIPEGEDKAERKKDVHGKRKRKERKEPVEVKKKGKKNGIVVEDASFFEGL